MEKDIATVAHDACNEALSISMGVRLLADVPTESITVDQREALSLIRDAADRLHGLIQSLSEISLHTTGSVDD